MHHYRFFDDTNKTLYLYTIFDSVVDVESKLRNKKVELIIRYGREVFYEEIDDPVA